MQINTGALAGRRALVSGGGSGIGLATSRLFKAEGANVVILGRNRSRLEAAIAAGDADEAEAVDLTDDDGVEAMLERFLDKPFDILVANAGAATTAPFARTDARLVRDMIETNLISCTRLVRGIVPGMVARGRGRVVAIASTAGVKGYSYVSAYVAAKHAVVGYVRAVAAELSSTPVTINAVCPGFTRTELLEKSVDTIVVKTGLSRAAALAEMIKHNPQKRLVEATEVADAVLWLCGSRAAAINGQAIAVAGGEI